MGTDAHLLVTINIFVLQVAPVINQQGCSNRKRTRDGDMADDSGDDFELDIAAPSARVSMLSVSFMSLHGHTVPYILVDCVSFARHQP